jgi:protein-disulfide isomerase
VQNPIPVFGVIASVLFLPILVSGADVRPSNDPPVVEVNGVTLTLSDLERKSSPALFQARTAYYDAERKTLDEFIDDYVLQQQAQKENLSVAELLERHVKSTIAPNPSDEALRVYYEGVETTAPFEEVRDKIIDVVREKRIAKAKAKYLQSLRTQATIVYRLAPPRAPISMKDARARGPADAPVTLLEYADYECPYCQQIQPVLDKITEEYKGRLAFAYKDFPLPMHPNARKAAEASRCAQLQGKYWEYHDVLVTTRQLDIAALKSHARTLKLDGDSFDKCLDTGGAAESVQRDAAEAQALGVSGTPTFFVNGRSVSGAATYEKLRSVIAEELSAAVARGAAPREAVGTTEKEGPAR